MARTRLRIVLALAGALVLVGMIVDSLPLECLARGEEPGTNEAAPAEKAPPAGGRRITGVVVDEQGGLVAGAVVRAQRDPEVRTSRPPMVRSPSRSTDRSCHYPPLPAEVSLLLDGAQTMRIKVLDSKDQPVPGVVLSPENLLKPGKAFSARIVSGRPSAPPPTAPGWPCSTGFPGAITGPLLSSGPRRISARSRRVLRLPVPGSAELVVRVLRNTQLSGTLRFADGRPAVGVRVRAEGHGPDEESRPRTTLSGDDGSYTLDVPPDQSYMVTVFDPTWAAPSHTGIILREGQVQGGLRPRPAWLITDEQGRFRYSGAPVGSEGELSVLHRADNFLGARTAISFKVLDLNPVEVPDLVVPPSEPAKEAAPPAGGR